MDKVGRVSFENSLGQLSEAIRELSEQVQQLRQARREELESLRRYREEGSLLEFTLTTGGLIRGKILWMGNQGLGIRTDSGQDVILYKHAIAFIQERVD